MPERRDPLKAVHVASGDLWAGAEVQVFHLLGALQKHPTVHPEAVLLNEGELASRLRAQGVPVTVYDERKLSTAAVFRRLRQQLASGHADVVHTHRFKENILGSVAARLAGVPASVRTVHGAPEGGSLDLRKRALRSADRLCGRVLQRAIVAVSDDLADQLRPQFRHPEVVTIVNGADASALRDASVPPVPLDPNLRHVAIVGRLVPVKRIDLFLRVAAQLNRDEPGRWHFHVLGDGPLRDELLALRNALGLAERCTFHGFVADSPRWIAALHCLVLTSDHEGLPMVALEALAVGTPVVAHAVGGLVPLLQPQAHCRLVGSQDIDAFAAAVVSATGVPRAERSFPKEYEISYTADQYARLYRRLLPG